uniref:(California timema) hypothetical protein n=1 Tax=Timema californicum TaxID=61474 RepID=A0A7R9P905_TIMCA|nr:unnamed protein product [Timema californicum]
MISSSCFGQKTLHRSINQHTTKKKGQLRAAQHLLRVTCILAEEDEHAKLIPAELLNLKDEWQLVQFLEAEQTDWSNMAAKEQHLLYYPKHSTRRKAKNLKVVTHVNLEQAMLEWFSQHRAQNMPMMQKKADEFALRLGIENFKCPKWGAKAFQSASQDIQPNIGESASVDPTPVRECGCQHQAVRPVIIADCFLHAHFVLPVDEEAAARVLPPAASAEDPDDPLPLDTNS